MKIWRGPVAGVALRIVSVAVVLPGSLVLVATSGAATTVAPPSATVHYGEIENVCRQPTGPSQASCFAMRRVDVSKGTPGAMAFKVGGGSYATGPAGGYTPGDLASAYEFSPTATGEGQTVAIVDAYNDPNIGPDLQEFDTNYGLAACTTTNGCLTVVNQTGGSALPADDTTGWSVEESLDVETVHSVCEECNIILVEANSADISDLATADEEAYELGATEVTNSWGGTESSSDTSYEGDFNHPGIVVTASTGDDGYYDWDQFGAADAPNFPASFGDVVAVGGTDLSLNASGSRSSETVWDTDGLGGAKNGGISGNEGNGEGASGGGCSTVFPAQAWQTSIADWPSTACGTYRLAADVSADADPFTGFDIYDSFNCGTSCQTGWETVGGTSLSSPIIASMYALAGGGHAVSYPAETLYNHLGTSSLYDVTAGGDGYCDGDDASSCLSANGGVNPNTENYGTVDCAWTASGALSAGDLACDAGTGYDGPTGVGTPNGLGAFEPVGSAPLVASVSPGSGPVGAETTVTITGANFTGATAVHFGTTEAVSFSVDNDGEITAVSPEEGAGPVDITVTTTHGTSATSAADQYNYENGPVVTSISPSSGPTTGGTTVTIVGSNFTGATAVTFGSTAAESFDVVADAEITAESPDGSAGTVDITVTTPDGTSVTSSADQYTFVAPPPSTNFGDVVISPNSETAYLTVPAENEVAVLNLETGIFGTPIDVGSEPEGIDITPDGSTLYVCDSGAQAISVVDLATDQVQTVVTPPSGNNATPWQIAIGDNGTAVFTTTFDGSGFAAEAYLLNLETDAISVLTSVGENGAVTEATRVVRSADYSTAVLAMGGVSSGPVSIYSFGTGTAVNADLSTFVTFPAVSGTGSTVMVGNDVLDGTTGAQLGSVASGGGGIALNQTGTVGFTLSGSSIQELNTTRFRSGASLPLPAGESGLGQLVISPNGNTLVALTSTGAAIVQAGSPMVTSVSPASGPTAGGTTVTIAGANFDGATDVSFGGFPATSFTVNSSTSITAVSPAEAEGPVDVTVSGPQGTSGTSAADQYFFGTPAPPTSFGGVAISPGSQTAYLTVPSENEVAVLNLATGTFGSPIEVGSDPQGIDITPDGTTLYICDTGGQTISVVDLASDQVTKTIETPATDAATPWQIAIGNNGTAVFTTTFAGSGFGADAYLLNLGTDAISVLTNVGNSGLVTEATRVARSADYSTVAFVLGDDSGGPVSIYSFNTGSAVSAALNAFVTYPAVSGTGSTVMVGDGASTYVLDGTSGGLLGTITSGGYGMALNQAGTVGYILSGTAVQEVDTATFLSTGSLALPAGDTGTGELAISPDGTTLVALTSGGAVIIPTGSGSAPPTTTTTAATTTTTAPTTTTTTAPITTTTASTTTTTAPTTTTTARTTTTTAPTTTTTTAATTTTTAPTTTTTTTAPTTTTTAPTTTTTGMPTTTTTASTTTTTRAQAGSGGTGGGGSSGGGGVGGVGAGGLGGATPPSGTTTTAAATTTTLVPVTTTTASTTTTTAAPTTTTTTVRTKAKHGHPSITALTKEATLVNSTVELRLSCAGGACPGVIKLWADNILLGTSRYSLAPGQISFVKVRLSAKSMDLMARSKGHPLEAGETVTVAGGPTLRVQLKIEQNGN
jgi:YVTN family beta-propeller protein